eukprot:g13023.t1
MGVVKVPKSALWGAQTQRSLENFVIGDDEMPAELIQAFAVQKKACALANRPQLGDHISDAIQFAADTVLRDGLLDQFPLVVYQTGSGTQTNMNVNEVLANLANQHLSQTASEPATPAGASSSTKSKLVHPNDHVNRGQSTNDSFPTAMHIAVVVSLREKVLPALQKLAGSLREKETEFKDVVKIGRTHLQDATPLTLGQEFSAWAVQVEFAVDRIHAALPRLYLLPQGGTAVGTGLNQVEGFDTKFSKFVNAILGYDTESDGAEEVGEQAAGAKNNKFRPAPNKFEGIAAHDAFVEIAGVQNTIAGSLMKIANDLRLLSSGPTGGLAEVWLPANEPGSSIMPGKVNPTQAEAMSMVAAQVMGNSLATSVANSHGHLDLQAFKPVIIFNVLKSNTLIADVAASFADKCVAGITPNYAKIREHLEKNLMLVTALNPKIGILYRLRTILDLGVRLGVKMKKKLKTKRRP